MLDDSLFDVRQEGIRPRDFIWFGKEKELLDLWNNGLSLGQIAARFGVNRGTVSGKIFRLRQQGWVFDKRAKPPISAEKRRVGRLAYWKARTRANANSDRSATQRITQKLRVRGPSNGGAQVVECVARDELPQPADFLGIAFAELAWAEGKPSNCRFPSNSPPFVYCGQPVRYGASYCPSCYRIAYSRPAAPNPAAKVWRFGSQRAA